MPSGRQISTWTCGQVVLGVARVTDEPDQLASDHPDTWGQPVAEAPLGTGLAVVGSRCVVVQVVEAVLVAVVTADDDPDPGSRMAQEAFDHPVDR